MSIATVEIRRCDWPGCDRTNCAQVTLRMDAKDGLSGVENVDVMMPLDLCKLHRGVVRRRIQRWFSATSECRIDGPV